MNHELLTTGNRRLATLFDICRMFSTNQTFIMQNEPNFRKSQMNVNTIITRRYKNISNWTLGENEPKTNPIKPNFKKAKINVFPLLTKDYENKPPIRAPKKRIQFSLTTKTNANLFATKDYEKNRDFGFRQNKAKQTQCLSAISVAAQRQKNADTCDN